METSTEFNTADCTDCDWRYDGEGAQSEAVEHTKSGGHHTRTWRAVAA